MGRRSKVRLTKREETTIQRQFVWNDFYSNNNFGLGVECTKCKKWRKVYDYKEPHQVPEDFECSMANIGNRKGSCDIPSDLTEDDFSSDKYTPGSVVWAKLGGFPWWPGIVEDNPDIEEYTWSQNGKKLYHVTYFGDEVSRSWVKEQRIMPFVSRPKSTVSKKYKSQLEKAIQQAEEAGSMDIQERLKYFSFAVRYKGKAPKADDFGTGVPNQATPTDQGSEGVTSRTINLDSNQETDSKDVPRMKRRKVKRRRKVLKVSKALSSTNSSLSDENDSINFFPLHKRLAVDETTVLSQVQSNEPAESSSNEDQQSHSVFMQNCVHTDSPISSELLSSDMDEDHCLKPNKNSVFNPSEEIGASSSLDSSKRDKEQNLDTLLKIASPLPEDPEQPVNIVSSSIERSFGNRQWKCILEEDNPVDLNNPNFRSYTYYTKKP